MCAAMVVAIGSVHWGNGFWNGGQGFEFNLALLSVPIAVALFVLTVLREQSGRHTATA
jgi:uncharacterized membrane protein YphA (DoxX/SURF4 family)